MKIKQMLCIAVAFAFAGMALAAKMTLTEARAEIGKCIANPAKMTSVVKQLSAQDQIAFLAEVNRAISEMPGSPESKAATYLDVNRAAVRAADAGNKTAMIAEVFATVPLEVLTVLVEFPCDFYESCRARRIVVCSIVDLILLDSKMVKMSSEDYEFILELRAIALDDADHIGKLTSIF